MSDPRTPIQWSDEDREKCGPIEGVPPPHEFAGYAEYVAYDVPHHINYRCYTDVFNDMRERLAHDIEQKFNQAILDSLKPHKH